MSAPVAEVRLCREDNFYYAVVTDQSAVKPGDPLYAAPVAAPVAGQEPVAYQHISPDGRQRLIGTSATLHVDPHFPDEWKGWTKRPLIYGDTAPVPAASVQPEICKDGGRCGIGGYCKNCHTVPDSGRDAALEVKTWQDRVLEKLSPTERDCQTDVTLNRCASNEPFEEIAELRAALAAHPANVAQVGELSDSQISRIADDLKQHHAGTWPGEIAFARAVLAVLAAAKKGA